MTRSCFYTPGIYRVLRVIIIGLHNLVSMYPSLYLQPSVHRIQQFRPRYVFNASSLILVQFSSTSIILVLFSSTRIILVLCSSTSTILVLFSSTSIILVLCSSTSIILVLCSSTSIILVLCSSFLFYNSYLFHV